MFIAAYRQLLKKLGPSNWWPGDSPFEVMVGAILTQNTSWKNVEKAIGVLKEKRLLAPRKMAQLPQEQLAPLIRSSGYFNQKARKLLTFLDWYARHGCSVAGLKRKFQNRQDDLRDELLGLHGIGPETADSILCYALDMPYFVVDLYTFRWLERYRPAQSTDKYEQLRAAVEKQFAARYPPEELTVHLGEFHALLVRLCNRICVKRNPQCDECPLRGRCAFAKSEVRGRLIDSLTHRL